MHFSSTFRRINGAMLPDPHSAVNHRFTGPYHRSVSFVLALLISGLVYTTSSYAQQTPAQSPVAQTRKATLKELYAMFFLYSAHVESRSLEDEKAGNDRTFYRHHLQQASALTDDEYAAVLSAAQRYVAVDADVNSQLQQDIEAGATNGYVMNNFFQQLDSSLNDEIANVRQLLGQESVKKFEVYLQNEYTQQGSYPQPSRVEVSSPRSPSYSPSYTGSSSPQQILAGRSYARNHSQYGDHECGDS